MLITLLWWSFHNVYVYQYIKLYTLSIQKIDKFLFVSHMSIKLKENSLTTLPDRLLKSSARDTLQYNKS